MEGTLQMLVGNLTGFAIKQAEFDTWFPRLPPVWLWVNPHFPEPQFPHLSNGGWTGAEVTGICYSMYSNY